MSVQDVDDRITAGVDARLYQAVTDASGLATVTFAKEHEGVPGAFPVIVGGGANQFIRLVSVSTTQAVVHVFQRGTLNVLGVDLLASATSNVNGAAVNVWVA